MLSFRQPASHRLLDVWGALLSLCMPLKSLLHAPSGIQAVGGYKREDFVGICGFSSLDWITADYANTYCGESQYLSPILVGHHACALACISSEASSDEGHCGRAPELQSVSMRLLRSRKHCCGALFTDQRYRLLAGVTTVPLPTNIQAEDIVKIINEAELTCLVCSLAELGNLAALVGGCETVKTFIVMDLPPQLDAETEALLRKVSMQAPAHLPASALGTDSSIKLSALWCVMSGCNRCLDGCKGGLAVHIKILSSFTGVQRGCSHEC